MPKDALSKIASFVKFCEKQRSKFNISLTHIANMGEFPIWADMPSKATVTKQGAKIVPIKTTGHEKQRITVCLAVKADGTCSGAVVKCSRNGWMNSELTFHGLMKRGVPWHLSKDFCVGFI